MSKAQVFSPKWISAPGETISDAIREQSLTKAEFARQLGESTATVEAILDGRVAITIAVARRLETVLGASVEFWMTRDFQFREEVARREASDTKRWLAELPVSDMIRFGWLRPPPRAADEVRACLDFFDVPSIDDWRKTYATVNDAIAYRTSLSLDSRPGSVAAWLRRGTIEAITLNCAPWNRDAFNSALPALRALTRVKEPRRFIPELQRRCATCGVAVVVVRAPAGCRASGATFFYSEDRALLLLSSRYLADDQFWFTFFHEAGHLILHTDQRLVLEGMGTGSAVDENEANSFAERLIIPEQFDAQFRRLRPRTRNVIQFARLIGVAPGLVVGQLQHEGIISREQLNRLKRRYVWTDQGMVNRGRA